MKPNFIQAYSGLQVHPLRIVQSEICIEDIAHALSNICRFTGHTKDFYSVAQHSVLTALFCSSKNQLWGLLHDASEAYLCDMASPIKYSGKMGAYIAAEKRIMKTVAKKFGLPPNEPSEVKYIDGRMLTTEASQFGLRKKSWGKMLPEFDIILKAWTPKYAEKIFLRMFSHLNKTGRAK